MSEDASDTDVEQLLAIRARLRDGGLDDGDETPSPIFWPGLTADEAAEEWDSLRRWVIRLRARFPNGTRIPDCWWQHNDLVEALSALRDYERACFGKTAPATAAVEWHRAFRDVESRMETWIKRFTCSVAGEGTICHPSLARRPAGGPSSSLPMCSVDANEPSRSPTDSVCSDSPTAPPSRRRHQPGDERTRMPGMNIGQPCAARTSDYADHTNLSAEMRSRISVAARASSSVKACPVAAR